MEFEFFKYSKTLELDKILEMLAGEAALEDSARLARELTPKSDFDEVAAAAGFW